MVLDVANLLGVTSDESMETKLIICGLLSVESGTVPANFEKNMQNVGPIIWMTRLVSVTCYQ